MNHPLFPLFGITITGWKIVGYLGVAIFAGRWIVQLHASRQAGRPVMTRLFWMMSMAGSLMVLAYFIFGKNDSVGVLSNLLPAFVAGYNLYLDFRYHREQGPPGSGSASSTPVPAAQRTDSEPTSPPRPLAETAEKAATAAR